jgi:immune inhibitor A
MFFFRYPNFPPLKFLAPLIIMLIVGCSSPTETITPKSPTQAPPEKTATTAAPATPQQLPTREPLPEGLVKLPVPPMAEETVLELRNAQHPERDDYRLAQELLGVQPAQLTPEVPDPAAYEIGDQEEFYIKGGSLQAGDFESVSGYLRRISENAVWWKTSTAQVDESEIEELAKMFEEIVEPIGHLTYGREWSPGIDNDERVHFLLVREEYWGGYFGYFSPRDEFPTALQPYSNIHEMLVLNTYNRQINTIGYAGKLAHEFQHLIHWNLDPNEDQWVNEAMSELAYFFTGAPEASDATRLTNAELFALNPDNQLTARPERRIGDEDLPNFLHYAMEKSFMIYLFEQLGPQFIKDVANNPNPGVFSIQEELDKLPGSPRFEDIYASWLVANLIDAPHLMESQFGYKDYDPIRIQAGGLKQIRSLSGEPIADQLPPYGAHYYWLRVDQPAEVSFSGSTLAQLTPIDPASGEYAWYSNRGDQSEFTLTNTFDLTGLESATLNYKIWYELDKYYDYAYLEVSTDGGETWQVLETAQGTDQNPYDLSYGFGYTGAATEWLPESIDLTPYSGQEIQIRFHVITDFTTNRDGIQVDDISIPELGYFDSAEDDTGGWKADGFIRSSNLVPIEWVLWLVKEGQPMQVERIPLSADQFAEFLIEGLGDQYSSAAVIISPTAPVTTMEQDYELVFQHP